jgi:cytochrome c oxidase subunit IV
MADRHENEHDRHASHSLTPYVIVIVALFALTALTVVTALAHLPPWAPSWTHLSIALVIAAIKATLVLMFFMHVIHSNKINTVIIITSLFFLGLAFLFTISDYLTRDWFNYS